MRDAGDRNHNMYTYTKMNTNTAHHNQYITYIVSFTQNPKNLFLFFHVEIEKKNHYGDITSRLYLYIPLHVHVPIPCRYYDMCINCYLYYIYCTFYLSTSHNTVRCNIVNICTFDNESFVHHRRPISIPTIPGTADRSCRGGTAGIIRTTTVARIRRRTTRIRLPQPR